LLTWVEQLALAEKNLPVKEVELASYHAAGADNALPLIRKALEESSVKPTDPFDPRQFNNRFSAESSKDEASGQSPPTPATSD
jgi:hypothetical protein